MALPLTSFSDTVFGFLEEGERWPQDCSDGVREGFELDDEDEQNEESRRIEEDSKAFWDTQHQLLEATLCTTTTSESRVRGATKEAVKKALTENYCVCESPDAVTGCRNCLMRKVCDHLTNAGFNSGICRTKWNSCHDILPGKHSFLDVLEKSKSKKGGGQVRIIIELNFRAEFEMARACEEYNRLVRRLPRVLVGKVERLESIIKILCSAAKRCMKEKKMHMGPWRKQKYVQAKWLSSNCERTSSWLASPAASAVAPPLMQLSELRRPKPMASMLTVDFRRTAVEVV